MTSGAVVNPNDYLETPSGRLFTAERNRVAWAQAYADVEALLAQASRLYVVMGVQGAGKSSWIASQAGSREPGAVFFDAALPARQHRTRLLALALAEAQGVAVFVQATLAQALARNALRPPDKVVPETAVRRVFALLEPPSIDEGFADVILV